MPYLAQQHLLSIAPMMAWTDRHFRYFMRLLTRHTLLYTEMVTTGAILHGDKHYLLDYHCDEHPIALQVGGDDPSQLAECAQIGEEWGYDEINLNVGCPSGRVQSGNFGASLMAYPEIVRDCIVAMKSAVSIPVTVKQRIGIDDRDSYEYFRDFVATVATAHPERFTVHARKAWLQGLSPAQNRDIPPLRYDDVYRLKEEFADLTIELNGGVQTLEEAVKHLRHVDAVMIGRAAYYKPALFLDADCVIYGETECEQTMPGEFARDRFVNIINKMSEYSEAWIGGGGRLSHVTRHMLHLFDGWPGARRYRQILSEEARDVGAGASTLQRAAAEVFEKN